MHHLALRIALVAGGVLLVPAVAIAGLRIGLLLTVLALIAIYVVAHRMLALPLREASSEVVAIREHRFVEVKSTRKSTDELGELRREISRTSRAVEKEMREMRRLEDHRREFVGNVSHELKTPIFAVQGFAETLLDGALEDESVRRSFVEKILRNAVRLRNMAHDLGELSRIETGELRLSFEGISVERLFREVAESLELQAREREVTLHYEPAERLPQARGDREAVRQVMLNLVDNAIKYNQPGGRVEMSARQTSPESIRFTVADNGIGIDPEHVPRVTERFFRVDKSRSRSQGGTGLGLAIVKHLLAAHGTTLLVESTVGRGSTFGFTLPVSRSLRRGS